MSQFGEGAESVAEGRLRNVKQLLENERAELDRLQRNAGSTVWNWLTGELQGSKAYVEQLEEQVKIWEGTIQLIRTTNAQSAIDAALNTPISVPDTPRTPGGKGDSKKTWTPKDDEEYLKERNRIISEYNEAEVKDRKKYELELYEAEQNAYRRRLALNVDSAEDRQQIEFSMQQSTLQYYKTLADNEKKALELTASAYDAYAKLAKDIEKKAGIQINAENSRYEAEKKKYEEMRGYIENYDEVMEILELQHQNNLAKIQLDKWTQLQKEQDSLHKLNLATISENHKAVLESITATAREKAEAQRRLQMETARANYDYLTDQISNLEEITSESSEIWNSLTEQQKNEYLTQLANLRAQLLEANRIIKQNTPRSAAENWKVMLTGGTGSLFGISQSDWDAFFMNLREGTMSAKDLTTAVTAIGSVADESFKIFSKAMELANTQEKKEYDRWKENNDNKKREFEKRLNAGLMTQAQYDAEMEAMEKEQNEREKKSELDEAKRKKTLSIVEASINAALSVLKTFAQWGYPAGIAPAAIMTGLGAAQVAMIAAQPVGYAEGGEFDVTRAQDGRRFRARRSRHRGFIDRPTIPVGEEGREYVIPADGVNNPSLAPILNTIEAARLQGTLKNLNLQAAYPASTGYASGGYTRANQQTTVTANVELSGVMAALERILSKMEDPVPAVMTMLGPNGFEETYNKRQRQRSRGRING